MKKIAIDINEVVRSYYKQVAKVYYEVYLKKDKEYGKEFDELSDEDKIKFLEKEASDEKVFSIELSDLKDKKLNQILNMNKKELNKFLYDEMPLNICGFATSMEKNSGYYINDLYYYIIDEELDYELTIISKEFDKSIAASYFFLSKIGCNCPNVKFVNKFDKIWEEYDIIITADPEILNSKPDEKISIKINKPYNEEINSNYEFSNLSGFCEVKEKIIN